MKYEICTKDPAIILTEIQALVPSVTAVCLKNGLNVTCPDPLSDAEKAAIALYNQLTMGEV